MSEPVGNSPRATNIPGNSHKERELQAKTEPVESREPVVKIVEGKVTTRKQPLWKRATRGIIADDAQSIGDFIVTDIVIPGIRTLIYNAVVGTSERALFGTSKHRGSGIGIGRMVGSNVTSLRTRYDQMSGGEPRRMMSRESRARHDFDDVVLETRTEAIDVIENMIARVERYRMVSVADLYDFLGVTGSFADQRWGWTDLSTADVRQVRGGFLLDLPSPEPLR